MALRRSLPSVLVLGLALLAAPAAARADGFYFREAVGGSSFAGELADFYTGGLTLSLGLGRKVGPFAIELVIAGGNLDGAGPFAGRTYSLTSFGLDVKRLVPVTSWLSLYGRAGLRKTRIRTVFAEDSRGDAYAGRGVELGGGLVVAGQMPWIGLVSPYLLLIPQLRRGPTVTISGWLDVGRHDVVLRRDRSSSLGGAIDSLTLGFGLGGEF